MLSKILEVKNLSISFDDDKVIENLSFDLREQENLVIVGPNGSGKTVLLRALLDIIPFQGKIIWKKDVKISYVPQKILPDKSIPISVEEFFGFKKVSPEQIDVALLSVGIKDLSIRKKRIGVISSGQLQRILIAWGLVGNPDVLLFDEPTAGIDISGEETIYNLLAEIEKEKNLTIILVTHDLNVVYKFANYVLCLSKKFVCFGKPQETLSPESLEKLYGGDIKFFPHNHHEH